MYNLSKVSYELGLGRPSLPLSNPSLVIRLIVVFFSIFRLSISLSYNRRILQITRAVLYQIQLLGRNAPVPSHYKLSRR